MSTELAPASFSAPIHSRAVAPVVRMSSTKRICLPDTAAYSARKLLIIVGSESRVYQMVDNNRKMLRYTGLRWFLQQEAGKQNTPNDEADG